ITEAIDSPLQPRLLHQVLTLNLMLRISIGWLHGIVNGTWGLLVLSRTIDIKARGEKQLWAFLLASGSFKHIARSAHIDLIRFCRVLTCRRRNNKAQVNNQVLSLHSGGNLV